MPDVEAEKLVRAARNADKALITAPRVFDLYAGKGVPDGKKSHRHRRHPAAGRAHA